MSIIIHVLYFYSFDNMQVMCELDSPTLPLAWHWHVNLGSRPCFLKLRSVQFAFKNAAGRKIVHLEAEGIPEKVEYSDSAVPIVPVPKQDGMHLKAVW